MQLRCLGGVILCAAIAALNACDTGSSSGGIDPGIIEIPIAFIKRPIAVDDMDNEVNADIREPRLFMSGGDVFLRTSSLVDANVTNITFPVTGGVGDAKGLNASPDGNKLVFSLRLFDPNPNDNVVPSWNIYEYDMVTSQLRRIITSELTAEQGDDLFPTYLPDGRIVFSSDRQRQSREMRINEAKPTFAALDEDEDTLALVLHVMNADGSDIHQISFNQSHDLFPQVLTHYNDGKIAFSRWDNAVGNDEVNLYTVNPDGSDLEILYGARSHATGTGGATIQFTNFRETERGDLMVITRPFTGTFDGGDITLIDVSRFADNSKPVWSLSGLPGPAQSAVSVAGVSNDGSISANGRYATAFPLWDGSNRVLVSKSICQVSVNNTRRPCVDPYVNDPAAIELSPVYSLWLYDMDVDTEKPIVLAEAGTVITDVITVQSRTRPAVIFDKALTGDLDAGWEAEVVGVVNIRSVYDMGDSGFNGCFFNQCTAAAGINTVQDFADPLNALASERPARFVRFIKAVGIPDPNDPTLANPPDLDGDAFGLRRNLGMREIVGYAPVEPDGSVKVKVPANVPLAVEVLDGEGRRIGPRHDNWFQVQPGDMLACSGCHDLNNGGSAPEIHARSNGEAPSINSGAPASGIFANTQIPGTLSLYIGNPGQTMAEVRFDNADNQIPPAPEPQLSSDLVYDDYWTDPGARAPDASFAYLYANLDPAIATPANAFCSPWVFNCRVTINYPAQIHALFQLDRGADVFTPDAPANPPNNDPTNTPLLVTNTPDGVGDDTCISCHTTRNDNNDSNSVENERLPYGQLDLTTRLAPIDNARFRSYEEMFTTKTGRFFDGMTLVKFTIDIPDGMGGTDTIDDPVATINPSMSVNGARASYFLEKLTGTELDAGRSISGNVDHSSMLTADELKLIGEWLDLGGQNFNNPFDPAAPQN